MKIGLKEIKEAVKDERFLDSLPSEFKEDIIKYKNNPSCNCNTDFYKKIFSNCKKQLKQYFPHLEVSEDLNTSSRIEQLNDWSVINCHIDDLNKELKKIRHGKKQIAIARYEDQVTVVINEVKLNINRI